MPLLFWKNSRRLDRNFRRPALLLRVAASDYIEAGRYGDSADAYARLLGRYRVLFSRAEAENVSDNQHFCEPYVRARAAGHCHSQVHRFCPS